MTEALTFAAGLLAGTAITGWVAAHVHQRWADEHHYRRVRLQATRVRDLYDDWDHERRQARRERKRAEKAEAVAHAYARLATVRRRPRYARFLRTYGTRTAA